MICEYCILHSRHTLVDIHVKCHILRVCRLISGIKRRTLNLAHDLRGENLMGFSRQRGDPLFFKILLGFSGAGRRHAPAVSRMLFRG